MCAPRAVCGVTVSAAHGDLVQRVVPEGKTLHVGQHSEVFAPADAPPPEPTPTPSLALTHTVHLPLLRGGCGYLVDGRIVPPTKYTLLNGKRIVVRQGCNGPVTCYYHDHSLVAPSGLPASGLVPPAPGCAATAAGS